MGALILIVFFVSLALTGVLLLSILGMMKVVEWATSL